MIPALLAIFICLAAALAHGDDAANVIQKFDGTDVNISTATFSVNDQWELYWFTPRPMNITVLTTDGKVVTGFHALFKGSIYMPKGGSYYLQINSDHPEMKAPWHLVVAEVASGNSLAGQQVEPMLANGGDQPYAPPGTVLPSGTGNTAGTNQSPGMASTPQNPFTHTATTQPAPTPNPQPAAITPPPNPPAPIAKLTEDQARAVVLITGDNAEGTGFMIKTPDGPAVITNIHVIANNPHLKVTTSTGALVDVLSMKGASDRDLAMLTIKDYGYSYFDYDTDISRTVQPGDDVITPGNSQGGEVMLNTAGKVLGIGPVRIEIDNPIYHGNSGGPVFHPKSGKVLGVVTQAEKVDVSNDLDKASFASRNSAITGNMRYFALRLDTVTDWVPIDQQRFAVETLFLDQFHEQSRRLDAYLNPPVSGSNDPDKSNSSNSDANIYLSDDKIMKAIDTYHTEASGTDTAGHIDALRDFLFSLQSIASSDVDQIQSPDNFYSFDKERAQEELDYRKELIAELDAIGNDVTRLGELPRTNGTGSNSNDNSNN